MKGSRTSVQTEQPSWWCIERRRPGLSRPHRTRVACALLHLQRLNSGGVWSAAAFFFTFSRALILFRSLFPRFLPLTHTPTDPNHPHSRTCIHPHAHKPIDTHTSSRTRARALSPPIYTCKYMRTYVLNMHTLIELYMLFTAAQCPLTIARTHSHTSPTLRVL